MANAQISDDGPLAEAVSQVERALANSAGRPNIAGFFDPTTYTISYVVSDPGGNEAAVIDSVLDYDPASGRSSTASADKIIEYITSKNLKVMWHLETHAHADHLSAAPYLQEKLGGKLAIGREIVTVQEVFGKVFNVGSDLARDGSQFDHLFGDGDGFSLGAIKVTILHVPGHTPADLAYIFGDAALVGDTLFMPDYGTARADFPGGDARKLFRSIRRLQGLPRETRVFLCHDYMAPGRDEYVWETDIGQQRDHNVHVRDSVSEDEFVEMRTKRDAGLGMPTLILPSVQVNIRAGHLPPPEENGVSYLKIPVDML